MKQFELDEWVIREVIDTLHQANITLSDEEYEMYLSCGYTFDDRGRMFNPNGDLVQ